MHYRIVVPQEARAARILKEVLASLSEDREMQRDLARLNVACGAPEKFVTLHSAPPPVRVNPPSEQGATTSE
jgi:hypothetical protein